MARGQRGHCWAQNQALGFRTQALPAPSAALLSVGDLYFKKLEKAEGEGRRGKNRKGVATGVWKCHLGESM